MENLSVFERLNVYGKIYEYLQGECIGLEQLIATSTWCSYWYAAKIIGGRFKLGEGVIATEENCNEEYQEFLESL